MTITVLNRAAAADLQSTDPVLDDVRRLFADVTRYPLEVIEPDADLENDLGIDSVKLGEVLSVLRERFGLPAAAEEDPDGGLAHLRTVSAIAAAIATRRAGAALQADAPVPAPEPAVPGALETPVPTPTCVPGPSGTPVKAAVTPPAPSIGEEPQGIRTDPAQSSANPMSASVAPESVTPELVASGSIASRLAAPAPTVSASVTAFHPRAGAPPDSGLDAAAAVQAVFAEITNYPLELLDPEAHLEDDLGLGAEIVGRVAAALEARHGLAAGRLGGGASVTTIAGFTALLGAALRSGAFPARGQVAAEPATPPDVVTDLPFAGRIALVTGSGKGIGRLIARQLAALGARVIVNSFHSRALGEATTREICETGGDAHHIWGSVANPKQLDALFDEIGARHGGLDFLVCNASNGKLAPLSEITPEHWDRAFRSNVVALHQSARRAAELMAPRGGGRIVTMSTTVAHRYAPAYGCMAPIKAGVETLSRYLAVELAPQNIQVVCVSAGPVYGERLDAFPDSQAMIRGMEARTPGGRLLSPESVAAFVAMVLRDEVSMLNGSVLTMDGGLTLALA